MFPYFSRKRALFAANVLPACIFDINGTRALYFRIRAYIIAKEPYVSAKEPYFPANMPFCPANMLSPSILDIIVKEALYSRKVAPFSRFPSKEPYFPTNDLYLLS